MSSEAASAGVVIRFTPSASDMVAVNDLIWGGWYRRIGLLGAAVSLIVILIAAGTGDPALAFGALLACLVFVLFWFRRVRRAFINLLIGKRYREILGTDPVVLTAGPSGLHSEQGASSTTVAWHDLTAALGDEHTIVLLKERSPRLFIPARAFASPSERTSFQLLLAQHLVTAR